MRFLVLHCWSLCQAQVMIPSVISTGSWILTCFYVLGGSYSNWWCSLFNAELALSIAMTTISTLLSIAFLPFNLYIYSLAAYRQSDAVQNINFLSLLVSIFIVIGAVTLGYVKYFTINLLLRIFKFLFIFHAIQD